MYAALLPLLLAPHALAAVPWANAVTKSVPLVQSDNQYSAVVQMGSDSAAQTFNLSLSTTLGYTVVAGTNCTDCASDSAPRYNASQSTTYQAFGPPGTVVNLGTASVAGDTAKENCGLKTTSGSFWAYANQTIVVVGSDTAPSSPFGSRSGIVGLGLTGVSNPGDSLFGQQIRPGTNRTSFNIGFALGNSDTAASGGQMHVAAPDPSAYSGDIDLVSVASVGQIQKPPILSSTDWAVNFTSWVFSNHAGQSANSPSSFIAIPELSLASIYVPATVAPSIYAFVSGSKLGPGDNNSSIWEVPCDAKFTFSATIGNGAYTVTEKDLVVPAGGNNTCQSMIRSWTDPSLTTYIMGTTFLRNTYVVFSASSSGMADSRVGFAPRATGKSKGTNVGAIVGGVIGGVAGVALLAGLGFLFYKRRQGNQAAPSQKSMVDERSSWYPASTTGSPAPVHYSGVPQTPGTAYSDLQTSPNQPAFQPLAPVHMEVERRN